MKLLLNIFAVLIVLAGLVWFLQGINVIPGSYMTGQIQWAYNGAIAILLGIAVLFITNRTNKNNKSR